MTIKRRTGDIFNSECEAIVNPVNCVGVMGKGLAKVFRRRYPENYLHYYEACLLRQLVIGRMFVTRTREDSSVRFIVNFPTKHHWSQPSKIEYIDSGLDNLIEVLSTLKIKSIAIPALGCGCGGLSWEDVSRLIISKLQDIDDTLIELYEPE